PNTIHRTAIQPVPLPATRTDQPDVSLDDHADIFVLQRVLETESAKLAATSDHTHKFIPLAERFRAFRDDPKILEDPGPYYQLINVMDDLIDTAAGNSYLTGALANFRVHLVPARRPAK